MSIWLADVQTVGHQLAAHRTMEARGSLPRSPRIATHPLGHRIFLAVSQVIGTVNVSLTHRWTETQWGSGGGIQQEPGHRTWDRQQCSVNRQTEADKGKLMRRAAGSVTALPSYITNWLQMTLFYQALSNGAAVSAPGSLWHEPVCCYNKMIIFWTIRYSPP